MLTQDNRFIRLATPLGENVLLARGFQGTEGLSRPFAIELVLVSEDSNIRFQDIVGKNVTLAIGLFDGGTRYLNGIISRFLQTSGATETQDELQLAQYSATMVPWFWLLTRSSDSRIFQGQTVPEIVGKIFDKPDFRSYSYKMNLQGSHLAKEYCVQYQETDFNFVSRLLEKEGIFYFFEHENGNHTMVLADSPQEHKLCPGQETARCQSVLSDVMVEGDTITALSRLQEIMPGKYTAKDYNFKMPSSDLKVEVPSSQRLGPGELEKYDYPGEYTSRAEGETLANLRMQAEEARITTITGSSTCRAFSSGYRFVLTHHYRDDMNYRAYVLTTIHHWASEPVGTSGDQVQLSYGNSFTCIPWDVPYRPSLITPKPVINGAQTAIVVGKSGDEIHTDEHGRIVVQFHWDRWGTKDDKSSCWIRVGQLWAGPSWGSVYIPRIGQEVIVNFLEGDPDRPIIVGCVYHGDNRPPYDLPAEKTKSTIKSDSTIGGGGFNEIRFEDKKGEEEIYTHAQKDMTILVGNDRTVTVHNNDILTVEEGDKTTTIQKGNETRTVSTGNMDVSVPAGAYTLQAKSATINATTDLTLTCGGSSIKLTPGSIKIESPMIDITSAGVVTIKGSLVKINC